MFTILRSSLFKRVLIGANQVVTNALQKVYLALKTERANKFLQ